MATLGRYGTSTSTPARAPAPGRAAPIAALSHQHSTGLPTIYDYSRIRTFPAPVWMSNSTSPNRPQTAETVEATASELGGSTSGDRARFHFSRCSGNKFSFSPSTSREQEERNEMPNSHTNAQLNEEEYKSSDQGVRSTHEFIFRPNNGQRSPAVPLYSPPTELRNQQASSARATVNHPLLDSRPSPPGRLDSRLYQSMRLSSGAQRRPISPILSPTGTNRTVSRTMDGGTAQNGNSRSTWQQSRQVVHETSYSANQTTPGLRNNPTAQSGATAISGGGGGGGGGGGTEIPIAATNTRARGPRESPALRATSPVSHLSNMTSVRTTGGFLPARTTSGTAQTPSQSGSTGASATGSHVVSIEIPISASNMRARGPRESPVLISRSPVPQVSHASSVRQISESPRTMPRTRTYKSPPVVHDDGRYLVSNQEEIAETVSEAGTTRVIKRTTTRRRSKSRPSSPVAMSQREENSFAQSLRSQSRIEASTASTLVSSRKPAQIPHGSPSRDRFNARSLPEPPRLPAHRSSTDLAPRKPDLPAAAEYDRFAQLKELLDYERYRLYNRSSPGIPPPLSSANSDFAPAKPVMPGVRQMSNQRSSLSYNRDHGFGGPVLSRASTPGVPIRTVSQTNVQNYSNNLRNNWISEHNLRDVKQPPIYSTYSAHRENMRSKEQNQMRTSSRHLLGGVGEIVHETISLQPIGPGIHDLETPTTPATLPRVIGGRSNSYSGDIASAYRHPKLSPTLPRTSGKIVRTRHESASQWRTTTDGGYHQPESSLGSIGGTSLMAQEAQMNHVGDTFDTRSAIYQAQESSAVWLLPNISKEDAQAMLMSREPGNFLIRTSKSRPNCYVLVLRVPASLDGGEPVRAFLIERTQMRSGRGDSYHLQGFQAEPVYPTLAALVQDHTVNRGALPVCLKLPTAGMSYTEGYLHSFTSTGARQGAKAMGNRIGTGDFNCDVLFLGNSDVFPLENAAAVRRAVEQILINAKNPSKGLKKKCEALVSISADKTLTIVDKTGLRFQKKTIAGNKIRFCGYDPEERVFNCPELRNRGVVDAQIFAIVVKKTRFAMTEHVVYVMCQLDAHQPSSWLVNYINRNVMGQHR